MEVSHNYENPWKPLYVCGSLNIATQKPKTCKFLCQKKKIQILQTRLLASDKSSLLLSSNAQTTTHLASKKKHVSQWAAGKANRVAMVLPKPKTRRKPGERTGLVGAQINAHPVWKHGLPSSPTCDGPVFWGGARCTRCSVPLCSWYSFCFLGCTYTFFLWVCVSVFCFAFGSL